jgi:nitrate/nitrite transporter NarK
MLMSKRNRTWISDWNPENEKFWESGKYIARRNLIWSIVAEHLGFSIWLLWSIVTTKLPQAGFHYTTDQLFQLVALPGLIGSGGLLADKIGGANVTFWNFIAMCGAVLGVIYFVDIKNFAGFLTMFLILFVTTGIGNGSTYRMIPSIFRAQKLSEAKGQGETGRALALKAAGLEAGAALGFIGAVGACGGYLIPRGVRRLHCRNRRALSRA